MQSTIVYRPDFTVGGFIQKIGGLYLFRFDDVHGSEFFHVHPDEYWWLDREWQDFDDEFLYVDEVVLCNLKLVRDDGRYFIDDTEVTGNVYLTDHIDDLLCRRGYVSDAAAQSLRQYQNMVTMEEEFRDR